MPGGMRRIGSCGSPSLYFVAMAYGLIMLSSFLKLRDVEAAAIKEMNFPNGGSSSTNGRKWLQSDDGGYAGGGVGNGGDMNRIGSACSKDDIGIFQGQTASLPNGIPAYVVEITNSAVSGCAISDIHVSCGWFSSARLVNPMVFKRVYYDDCLVNGGEALGPGQTLSFQYANSFPYPLSVASVACC